MKERAEFINLLYRDLMFNIDPDWSLPETIKKVVDIVGEYITNHRDLKTFLRDLPKGTICPDSPVEELHKYIATRYGKIDRSNPMVTLKFMKNFISETAILEREAISYSANVIKDITSDELVMITNQDIPRAMDKLWCRWFETLVVPFESLPEKEREQKKEELKTKMNTYDYTVFVDGERLAWANAFSWEITVLTMFLGDMKKQLEDKKIKEYIQTLIDAFNCTDIEELEKKWTDVDYAWIEISKDCRVFPVHGMESGYEHPYGVSPEWRIMVRLDLAKKEIDEICDIAPSVVKPLGADADSLKQKLKYTDIGVFYSAIWAGTCMNFRYSGQAVPNRQDVAKKGGKIFMDFDSIGINVGRYKDAIDEYVAEDTASVLKNYITPISLIAHTAGHEVSHPAGRSEEIDSAIGGAIKLLEEAKATMNGNLINESIDKHNRLYVVAEAVARICRFFAKTSLENTTSRQYVWENMVACTTLHKAGIIKVGNDRIEIDLGKAESRVWFEELEKFITQVFNAYKDGDTQALERIHKNLCDQNSGIVAEIIALVNKEE